MNQYITLYRRCGLLFGSYIAGINLYNIPPNTIKSNKQIFSKYISVSLIKGVIYGTFFPLSIIAIYGDNRKYNSLFYNRHFIPCSSYFINKPH